jgi:RimJ/RimL family protein N-acetyltransferase
MNSRATSPRPGTVVETRLGKAALRDLAPEDIQAIVAYWHMSAREYLDFLGIDWSRLGSVDDTQQRFITAIPTGDLNQRSLAWAIIVDGKLVGYTLLNRYTPDLNYSHWHITEPQFRAQGLSSALYPRRIKTYFDSFPMERLIHQTRTRNIGVNRMLDKFVPIAETCYIEDPDGVALPGEFHLRYVFQTDIPRFFEIRGAWSEEWSAGTAGAER